MQKISHIFFIFYFVLFLFIFSQLMHLYGITFKKVHGDNCLSSSATTQLLSWKVIKIICFLSVHPAISIQKQSNTCYLFIYEYLQVWLQCSISISQQQSPLHCMLLIHHQGVTGEPGGSCWCPDSGRRSLTFSPAQPNFLIIKIPKGDLNTFISMVSCPSLGH